MGLINLYRQRKRAIRLGSYPWAGMWYDPETGDMWQAKARWSLFTVKCSSDNVEAAMNMLDHVHTCRLEANREDVLEQ